MKTLAYVLTVYLCIGAGWALADLRLMHDALMDNIQTIGGTIMHCLVVTLIWPYVFVAQLRTNLVNRRLRANKRRQQQQAQATKTVNPASIKPDRPE